MTIPIQRSKYVGSSNLLKGYLQKWCHAAMIGLVQIGVAWCRATQFHCSRKQTFKNGPCNTHSAKFFLLHMLKNVSIRVVLGFTILAAVTLT
jgi:hypothetical protein